MGSQIYGVVNCCKDLAFYSEEGEESLQSFLVEKWQEMIKFSKDYFQWYIKNRLYKNWMEARKLLQ